MAEAVKEKRKSKTKKVKEKHKSTVTLDEEDIPDVPVLSDFTNDVENRVEKDLEHKTVVSYESSKSTRVQNKDVPVHEKPETNKTNLLDPNETVVSNSLELNSSEHESNPNNCAIEVKPEAPNIIEKSETCNENEIEIATTTTDSNQMTEKKTDVCQNVDVDSCGNATDRHENKQTDLNSEKQMETESVNVLNISNNQNVIQTQAESSIADQDQRVTNQGNLYPDLSEQIKDYMESLEKVQKDLEATHEQERDIHEPVGQPHGISESIRPVQGEITDTNSNTSSTQQLKLNVDLKNQTVGILKTSADVVESQESSVAKQSQQPNNTDMEHHPTDNSTGNLIADECDTQPTVMQRKQTCEEDNQLTSEKATEPADLNESHKTDTTIQSTTEVHSDQTNSHSQPTDVQEIADNIPRGMIPEIHKPTHAHTVEVMPGTKTIPQSMPGTSRQEVYQPLTLEQLNSLYFNPKLETNIAFIDRFVQNEIKRESHEFYEILLNYQRARKNLLLCEAALTSFQNNYDQLQQDVWVTEMNSITAKGVCGDGSKCQTTHAYERANLNNTAVTAMKKTLENIQDQIQNQLSLHSYSVQLSKLQVESYIHNLFVTSPALRDIPTNLPVYGCERQTSDVSHQLSKLKTCISILFHFHRQPIQDEDLLINLQHWTQRLVSVFLRVCTFEDQLFLLNHVMRCPAGIGTWAAVFIQTPAIPTNEDTSPRMFGNAYLDHVIIALSTVLMTTSGRSEFLCQLQKMFTPGTDNKTISWVMVDSDGEEDEDPQNAWMYLHENDVVAILRQLPLAAIFRHIFFIERAQYQDSYEYSIEKTTESTMYRMYAFCTCLVRILGQGLKTYNMTRYRQLNKRLGRMIRQCVQLVSDHWENFNNANRGVIPTEVLYKLQGEFDAFFLRAVNFIHMSQRLGSWQFIADMPFTNISKETMWKLLWLLHEGEGQWSSDISTIPPLQQCMAFVKDPSSRSQLSDIVQHVPESECVYLLNTMTNMTQACSSADIDFIQTVTMSVFEVSYICPETRDMCSKMGRELLSTVVTNHPFMVSILTQRVHEYMDRLGPMGVYLYKGLPLDAWLPSDPDILIIRQWLLNSDLGSPQHLLAQLILNRINWGKNHKGERLMVPWRVHKLVSVLIVEAYQKFILGKHFGSAIMEGVKQMSAAVQQYSTNEQEFNSWCWELLLKLSLHRTSLPQDDQRLVSIQGDIPDLDREDALLPLVKGIQEKNPAACYVALTLTKIGHGISEFISDGMPLLQVLTEQGLFKCTTCILYYTLPMFIDNQKSILDSIRFEEVLLAILQADESYYRVVKGLLSYDFPGPITKLFTSMIQSQLQGMSCFGQENMCSMLILWTKLILKLYKWYQDRNCCCVLDTIIHAAFTYTPALDAVIVTVQQYFKDFCHQEKNQGVMSSIVNWVTSGVTLPTFLDKSSYPECSWLAYVVLSVEGRYEQDTNLWSCIQEEMLSNVKVTVDQALKKSIMKLKLDQAPTYTRLNIYRWAQQALDMPISHPVAVLTWQKFFLAYLGRTTSANLPTRSSVGGRFFTGMSYSSMLKKMKKRLGETADYYLQQISDSSTPGTPVDEDVDIDLDVVDDSTQRGLYSRLARVFQTYQLWIEEPLLHDAKLYLPSLPPPYQADRLLKVFHTDQTPWFEYIDMKSEENILVTMATEWQQSHSPDRHPLSPGYRQGSRNQTENSVERILSRLARYEEPLPPPPVQGLKAPVPDVSPTIMEDRGAILHLLQSDLGMLKEYAQHFCFRMSKQATLDHYYLEFVPQLYQNVEKQVTLSLQCTSMINPLHRCSKPGSVIVTINEKWNDPIVQRQADENRAEYRQCLIEGKQPLSHNVVVCAVHTENAITLLVKLYRASTDTDRRTHLNTTACTLFFSLGETVTDNVLKYPPTQQFFSSCIDILGQEFIQHDASQTEHVLQMSVERADLAGLLSPHFKPNLSPQHYVSMYTRLVHTLHKGNTELTFMLLTKFDVGSWLMDYGPSQQEVKKFIHTLSQALMACGAEPDDNTKLVFGQYVGHEKILLTFRFPLYLNEIMAVLLKGSAVQKISVVCWEELHRKCFYSNSNQDVTIENQQYQDVLTNLSTDEVKNILRWLGHEFLQIRLNQKDAMTFGLYPKWQRYIVHLAGFLQDLCKCYIDKMVPNIAESSTNEGIENVWRLIMEGFSPWIQPLYNKNVASMPWIEADRQHAGHMVRALAHVVGYAHYKTLELRGRFYNDFLSLLWLYFSTVICKADVTADVIAVFNLELVSLPWKQLLPNIHVMETLAQLKEYGSPLGFNLCADIVSVVPWDHVSQWYDTYHNHDTCAKYEGCLFLLLIQAYAEKKHLENPDMEAVLTSAQNNRWQHLSADAYKCACSWFMQSCDPKCLLLERTSPDAIGLRVLKSASGFTTSVSAMLNPDWTCKRLSYLHSLSSLICQCTYIEDCDPSSLNTVIINLLTEIETVQSAVTEAYIQCAECTDMMKEMLSLLNNCNPDNQGASVVMTTVIQWLQDSPQTILLSPCIHAASRSLASLTYMVQLIEQCIRLTFVSASVSSPTVNSKEDPWARILGPLQIPELNLTEFFNTCLEESSFLLLYCYILQKVPLCQGLTEEQGFIELILDWMDKAKPSAETENKLLLWWHKYLEMVLRQVDYGRDGHTCVTLLRKFTHKLQVYGEDRTSVGLLGAIGLGKKSLLTEKFRLCSRAVACFCNNQVLDDRKLRLQSTDPPSKHDLSTLLALKTNKKYQPIKTQVDTACDFVTDQSKCLRDVLALMSILKESFYSNQEYLSVISSLKDGAT